MVPNAFLLKEKNKELEIKKVFDLGRTEVEIIYLEKQTELEPFKCYGQYDLWYIIEGSCSALIDGKQKRIKDGDILITNPNRLHGIRNNSKNRVIILSVKFPST